MTAGLLRAIDHLSTHEAVLAERAFCRALGGTCHSPIAALATVDGDRLRMRVQILAEDGSEALSDEAIFVAGDDEAPRRLAGALLDRAPHAIRNLFGAA